MTISALCTYEESLDARKITARATSSASPQRSSGTTNGRRSLTVAICCGVRVASQSGVPVYPGVTTLPGMARGVSYAARGCGSTRAGDVGANGECGGAERFGSAAQRHFVAAGDGDLRAFVNE